MRPPLPSVPSTPALALAAPPPAPSHQELVELNVGGTVFCTFRSTLAKHPQSMLAAMFSGRHPLARDERGRPFVDRSPKMFALVLEYLRTDIYPAKLLKLGQVGKPVCRGGGGFLVCFFC